ncbi:MAG TPA: hypothetical protein VM452_19735 [Caulifigura sp.]|nr:hypothetical protein [Caulifigura sp.]
MAGRLLRLAFLGLLFGVATLLPRIAAGEEQEAPEFTVRQMQEGGFVFDKGTRFVKDPRLKISMTPMFETFRTQAPLNVNVRLQWTGSGLLEGRVLCDMYAFERYVGSWKSHELAVNDQILSFPLTLPPSPLYNDRDLFNLRIAFEASDRTILMDQRDLPVESGWSRNLVVGIVAPEGVSRISGFKAQGTSPQVADLFQVASFHDIPTHSSQFVTNHAPVITRDLPLDPLRLTAFDLILLSPEALREIKLPQWQALSKWIRAGGRACLVATVPVPENLRPAWRELFNERPEDPKLTFSDTGRAEFASGGSTLRVRAGCGRILCLNEPASVDTRAWLDDSLWLIGVREGVRSSILANGKWAIGPVTGLPTTFHPLVPTMRPIPQLRQPLNSPEVGRVSPMTVLFLLGTCLMLIGPVDYFVLGRLGMRKLTWVFLPCVAIATTWATMRVSQSSLGAKDYAMSLSIADLDSVGKVTRVSRIEQRYAGREGVHQRTESGVLRLDFERALLGWNATSNGLVQWDQNGIRAGDEASNQPPLRYEGRITGGYSVFEPMFQWSPRLFRETTFGDDPRVNAAPLARIDWPALSRITWATPDGRSNIRELVRKAMPEADVYVRFGLTTWDCSKTEPLDDTRNRLNANQIVVNGQVLQGGPPEPEGPEALVKVVGQATSCQRTYRDFSDNQRSGVVRPYGLFGLVRERAPTCGADLEDLQWIDAEDPTEAVLMILVKGEDSVIYRRRLAIAADAR